jgi:hypothetical protein
MPSGYLDLLLTIFARVLTVMFFIGVGGSVVVIVLTTFDIGTDIATPDVPAAAQIDADKQAA